MPTPRSKPSLTSGTLISNTLGANASHPATVLLPDPSRWGDAWWAGRLSQILRGGQYPPGMPPPEPRPPGARDLPGPGKSGTQGPSSGTRLLVAGLAGLAAGAAVTVTVGWRYGLLAAWMFAAVVFLVQVWSHIARMDPPTTAAHAVREDSRAQDHGRPGRPGGGREPRCSRPAAVQRILERQGSASAAERGFGRSRMGQRAHHVHHPLGTAVLHRRGRRDRLQRR